MNIQATADQGYIPIELPIVPGSSEYEELNMMLAKIDTILIDSGIEKEFRKNAPISKGIREGKELSLRRQAVAYKYASYALRCNIARSLSQLDCREFSERLSDSILLRRFCGYDAPDAPKKMPGKSTIHRFSKEYNIDEIQNVIQKLLVVASDENNIGGDLLKNTIDPHIWLLDSTCVKLDMHHPVDWVLLRDAVKSIIRSIIQIRKFGLKHRMDTPESFVSQINKLSMEMTHTKRIENAKKERKKIFRRMKKIARSAGKHGKRYRDLLEEKWSTTELSKKQAQQILQKLNNILEQLPKAIKIAHERIIGERYVKNEDKILSLYEHNAYVYKRGKAGAEYEFGLQMLIGETVEGLIIDWELSSTAPRNDTKYIKDIVSRSDKLPESIQAKIMVTDRGFQSEANDSFLEKKNITSMLCPRSPNKLRKKLGDSEFAKMAKRRAQTEGRIGILKNRFIGNRLSSKGYENQQTSVAWDMLSHNLWVLTRLPWKVKPEKLVA